MNAKKIEGSVNIKWLMETAKERGWSIEKGDDDTVTVNGKLYKLIPKDEPLYLLDSSYHPEYESQQDQYYSSSIQRHS
jgi:hypothetical protein